jgi:anti-anti-sigma factor
MPIALNQNKVPNVIRLEGDIDITRAAELKKVLLQALDSKKELRLELTGTPELDVTALQLLWAVEREARRLGVGILLAGRVPDAVLAALEDAGFPEFPIPQDMKLEAQEKVSNEGIGS